MIHLLLILLLSICFTNPVFAEVETTMESAESIFPETETNLDEEETEVHESVDEEEAEEIDLYFGKTKNVGDQTEEGYELVWTDGSRKIFKNLKNNHYEDINGIVSDQVLVELGVISEEDASYIELEQAVPITLNATTEFENFEMEDSIIHNITITAYGEERYSGEEVFQPDFTSINLSRENDFTNTKTFNCTDHNFFVKAEIENDFSNAYRVRILNDGEETVMLSSDQTNYNLVISVYKPEHTITDTNLAKDIENWDYYASGQYAESRAEKSGYEMTEANSETESYEVKEIKETDHATTAAAIVVGILIFLALGITLILFILHRRANEDD